MSDTCAAGVPATVKWGKEKFSVFLQPGGSSDDLKAEMQRLTGVPIDRQKLMCSGAWKGLLADHVYLNDSIRSPPNAKELTVMLMGSADAAPAAPPSPVVFVEDLSAEEIDKAAAEAEAAALEKCAGNIVAIQRRPGEAREQDIDRHMRYQYNHFVNGLPQHMIEDLVARRTKESPDDIIGECAMTLGHELTKAYITSIACLPNGTVVTALDNGRIQLWRHAARLREVIHGAGGLMQLGEPGAVTCLSALPSDWDHGRDGDAAAFVTGGSGCLRVWSDDGEALPYTLVGPPGTTPNALVVTGRGGVAATFQQAHALNTDVLRLAALNDEQRQRQDEARAAVAAQEAALHHMASLVHVMDLDEAKQVRTTTLQPWDGEQRRVTSLATIRISSEESLLVAGDGSGGMRLWSRRRGGNGAVQWTPAGLLQLQCPGVHVLSICCMEPVRSQPGLVAVSVNLARGEALPSRHSAVSIVTPAVNASLIGAVFIVDVRARAVIAVLQGHNDVVQCMCEVPGGRLATAGGKKDGKVLLWGTEQWSHTRPAPWPLAGVTDTLRSLSVQGDEAGDGSQSFAGPSVLQEPSHSVGEMGYVFGLAILPNHKPGSRVYALAGARYNSVRVLL